MNSIRTSLVTMLIAAFTLVTFLSALNGYLSSMAEAERLMDSNLKHSVILLLATGTREGGDLAMPGEGDEFAFQAWRGEELVLRSSGAPEYAINDLLPGFRYANFAGYRWRTLTRPGQDNRWYIVAERADLRHMLAEKVVLESILPLLLWLPASAVLIWVLVGWGWTSVLKARTNTHLYCGNQEVPCSRLRSRRSPGLSATTTGWTSSGSTIDAPGSSKMSQGPTVVM